MGIVSIMKFATVVAVFNTVARAANLPNKDTVSSFTLEIYFSGYRRVFLSDYSGREMRPASLFLKISKKWDAQ